MDLTPDGKRALVGRIEQAIRLREEVETDELTRVGAA